jgi:hypothetical protein
MGIEPTRETLSGLASKRFGATADPKCDGRVNFRGMWDNVGIRAQTLLTSEVLGGIAGRPHGLHVNQTIFSTMLASAAPRPGSEREEQRARRRTRAAVIESGSTQPQRSLKSAGGCHSGGLGSFRFRFYCIHMGICLVFACFLSITFQRLALR